MIIGGDGLLGTAMAMRCDDLGLSFVQTSRRKGNTLHFDLRHPNNNLPNAKLVYLFAGVTSIQACDDDPTATHAINVQGIASVAKQYVERGSHVIFPSTSLVFDGTHRTPGIDHPIRPRTTYGKQKAEAERQLMTIGHSGPGSVSIVRLSKVLTQQVSLIEQWRKQLHAGQTIKAYRDRYVAPLPCAQAIDALLNIGLNQKPGIYHLSGPAGCTYADLAVAIAKAMGVDEKMIRSVDCKNALPAVGYTALGDCTQTNHESTGTAPPHPPHLPHPPRLPRPSAVTLAGIAKALACPV